MWCSAAGLGEYEVVEQRTCEKDASAPIERQSTLKERRPLSDARLNSCCRCIDEIREGKKAKQGREQGRGEMGLCCGERKEGFCRCMQTAKYFEGRKHIFLF